MIFMFISDFKPEQTGVEIESVVFELFENTVHWKLVPKDVWSDIYVVFWYWV